MSRLRKPLLLVIVLVAALAVATMSTGCKKNTPTAPAIIDVSTGTASATGTAGGKASVAVETGPITTPVSGNAAYTALLDAARKKYATTSQFRTYQMFAQGSTAIGEIEQITGGSGHIFVAWTGPDWTVVWTAPATDTGATAAQAAAALPTFSADLLGKIKWPIVTAPTAPAVLDEATLKASLETAGQAWAATTMSGNGKPYKTLVNKVAKDTSGTWWGVLYIQPTSDSKNDYQGLEFWCKYADGKWTSKLLGPEPPSPATYYPAAIVEVLQL
ncbi:MAG: hypothetical protein HGA39_02260 [Coriobacteriia bacterium]|nr:hypothetical protein [Coriobacteriia bacterium]